MNSNEMEMKWRAGGYLIQDNRIFKIKPNEVRHRYYNPFDEDLIQAFCSVNEKSSKSIENFLNNYGSLGLPIDIKSKEYTTFILNSKNMINSTIKNQLLNELNLYKELSNTFEMVESLIQFKNEVRLLKHIKKTMRGIDNQNIVEINNNIMLISDYSNIEFDIEDALKEFNIKYITKIEAYRHLYKEIVAAIINERISNGKITPIVSLAFVESEDGNRTAYKTTWKCESLLSAIYMQLHISIQTNSKELVFCAKCGSPTYREKYCSDRCAIAAAKANERAKKRNYYKEDIMDYLNEDKDATPEEILSYFISLDYDKSVLNLKFIKNIIGNKERGK